VAWVDAARDENVSACRSQRIWLLATEMQAEWAEFDRRIVVFDVELAASTLQEEAARHLATGPGIGSINATAMVAAGAGGGQRSGEHAIWAWRDALVPVAAK
jgi:transposase